MKKQRVSWRPMKAQTYKESKVTYPCQVQFKLNGLRAEYEDDQFISGDGVIWPRALVEHLLEPLTACLKRLGRLSWRPDGEFYKHGWSLQRINKYIGVGNLKCRPETKLIGFHIFDLVTPGSFNSRKASLRILFEGIDPKFNIKLVHTEVAYNKAEADAFYAKAIKLGYEGIIYRLDWTPKGLEKYGTASRLIRSQIPEAAWLTDTGYIEGKRPHWMLKRKDKFDGEFKIISMHEGKVTDKGGKHVGRMGGVVCITKDKKTFHVGSGFDNPQRQKYWNERKHPKKTIIQKMLRVEYGRLSDDGLPVEPRAFDGCIRDYA